MLNKFWQKARQKITGHYLYKVFLENRRLFIVLLIIALLPVTFSSFSLYYLQSLHEAYDFSQTNTALIFFCVTTLTMAFALTPTTFIAIIAGHYLSWPGLAGVVPSYLLAAVLGLLLGHVFRKTFIGNTLMQRPEVKSYFDALGHREFLLVIFGRLSPVLPFAMMNIAFAQMAVKWHYYLAGSLLGMFPRTFVFFWTGMNVSNIWQFLSSPSLKGGLELIPFILIVVSTVGIIWVLRSTLNDIMKKEGKTGV